MVGVDFLGQKDEMKIYMAAKKGRCGACLQRTKIILNRLIPLGKVVKKISVRILLIIYNIELIW